MTARLRPAILVALATAGAGLLGTSVQGVAAMDAELRSSARTVPAAFERDCPLEHRTTRSPEV